MKDKRLKNKEYSAGAVSKGFWFSEFRKYNQLMMDGYSDEEIKKKQSEENILLAPSEDYGKRMINEVSRRTRALPESIGEIIMDLSVSDQKILNVLGLMLTDRLFFEYMYEVIREKLIIGDLVFDNKDTRIFFKDKSEQSKKVNEFKSGTIERLIRVYSTYLREAGILEENGENIEVRKPILDISLKEKMKYEGLDPYLRVFLGE